eukprot:5073127-Pyramimonas_sp.AAC.1
MGTAELNFVQFPHSPCLASRTPPDYRGDVRFLALSNFFRDWIILMVRALKNTTSGSRDLTAVDAVLFCSRSTPAPVVPMPWHASGNGLSGWGPVSGAAYTSPKEGRP